ncbi:hypothetical protein [Thermocatellispora tengchongensis]|uniref:hypothetical protein n=1 Tax=Thermocatellispora tengchongensis TaxID=1073253 RepID=UPI003641E8BC
MTISGREREDGEAPYTYVVTAADYEEAIGKVKKIHQAEYEDELADLQLEEIFEGMPWEHCGYAWNDVRDSPIST